MAFEIFFLFSPDKKMLNPFSYRKNKENIMSLSCAESAHSIVSVNVVG